MAGLLLFYRQEIKSMKKSLLFTSMLLFAFAACEQKTEKTVTPTSTTETTTITATGVDTAAAESAARDAAHATGTAMETAGKEIQEQTKTDTRK